MRLPHPLKSFHNLVVMATPEGLALDSQYNGLRWPASLKSSSDSLGFLNLSVPPLCLCVGRA